VETVRNLCKRKHFDKKKLEANSEALRAGSVSNKKIDASTSLLRRQALPQEHKFVVRSRAQPGGLRELKPYPLSQIKVEKKDKNY